MRSEAPVVIPPAFTFMERDVTSGAAITPTRLRGLLVDWGGVLTSSVLDAFAGFCSREGLPPGRVQEAFRDDPAARELLTGLEIGAVSEKDFGIGIGRVLGVPPESLIDRLMADARPDPVMFGVVRAARAHGIATGLVSNSWGLSRYDIEEMDDLFDGVIISARVGIRKPDPEMYRMGAAALDLEPAQCVYVDDLGGNLKPARALGMATVLHRDVPTTVTELSNLFGIQF
jgi:putative hydrolase of the HAD superfamily